MRLFHFMQKRFAIENIEKSRLKVATLDSMNDPFEFYPRIDGALNEDIEKFKESYTGVTGFLCFSKRLGDPLQWAHYAENHKGICFEFNIKDKYLKKIKYIKKPMLISPKSPNWKNELVEGTLCKFKNWKYEREYRITVNLHLDGLVKENDLVFSPFSTEAGPSKIYLGIRCELTDKEREILTGTGLEVVQMTQDINSYSIIRA